jgi:2-methylcitrate dehydratase PrpD
MTSVTAKLADFIATARPPEVPFTPQAREFSKYLVESGTFSPDGAELTVGVEVGLRLLSALENRTVGGWSALTAALAVGSAAVGARRQELDPTATERAIGIAATQVGGFTALEATPLGGVQRAHAVAAGAASARLAAIGVEGHPAGLEGRRGLFALMAPDVEPDSVVDGLGVYWLVAGPLA